MNQNEKEVESIYTKQLEAILFSINLYSEDIINSWATKLNTNQSFKEAIDCKTYNQLRSIAPQIKSIVFSDLKTKNLISYCSDETTQEQKATYSRIKELLSDSSKKVDRLTKYIKSGYRKIEALGNSKDHPSLFMVFITNLLEDKDKYQTCIIEVDAERFIKELLGQKIQITAEDRFNIGIIYAKTKGLIYPIGNPNTTRDFPNKKPMWLFPEYEIGIQMKGQSIDLLVKKRTKSTLILIVFADVFFILSAFLVFRNVRKEMKLSLIKSDFISNVSHEIRTPLALISMYIESLEMDRIKSEEKKKEYYKVILNETQRLSGIVNLILNFSKIESGKRKYSYVEMDLNEMVENVLQSYKFHLNNKGFELKVDLDAMLPLIYADKEALSDSLVNLIDNAVKYSKDKKYVEIKTGRKRNDLLIEVTDKGIGISKDDQKLIFDRFFRVTKGDNVHEVKGTGLGLTIVKSIIEAHNGKIEVESTPGEGTTFRILLPVKNT
jgi:two-component system, OmpR family, phosphate regulon sensor histidine kinase PhoR